MRSCGHGKQLNPDAGGYRESPADLPLVAQVVALAPESGGDGEIGRHRLPDAVGQSEEELSKRGAGVRRPSPQRGDASRIRERSAGSRALFGGLVVHVLARQVKAEADAVRSLRPTGIAVVLELVVMPEIRNGIAGGSDGGVAGDNERRNAAFEWRVAVRAGNLEHIQANVLPI